MGVPQIVEPDRRQPGGRRVPRKRAREALRPQRLAVLATERQVELVPVAGSERQPFGGLALSARSHRYHGAWVEVDAAPAAVGLWPRELALADERLLDRRAPGLEVEVAPAQAEDLAPAHPGQCDEPPRREEPDADGDGFGDESQDQCPTDASTQGPCPITADTKLDGSASAKKKQRQKGKKIIVKVKAEASEDLDANASGKIKAKKKSYKLKPVTKSVSSGQTKNLKLKPKKSKDAKKIAKALKRGTKAKAKLTVELSDEAGNEKTTKLAVRLK